MLDDVWNWILMRRALSHSSFPTLQIPKCLNCRMSYGTKFSKLVSRPMLWLTKIFVASPSLLLDFAASPTMTLSGLIFSSPITLHPLLLFHLPLPPQSPFTKSGTRKDSWTWTISLNFSLPISLNSLFFSFVHLLFRLGWREIDIGRKRRIRELFLERKVK